MDLFVTPSTQGDQIPFRIIAEPAARVNMMHLEVTHRSAMLAAPPISLQYFFPQFVVRDRIQSVAVDVLIRQSSCGPSYLIQEFLPFEFWKGFNQAAQRDYQRIRILRIQVRTRWKIIANHLQYVPS
jgi:hypothetical protein